MKNPQQILRQLKILSSNLARFRFVITFVMAGVLFAYVIQSISSFAATEANQERYNEGLSSIKRTKFDQAAVDKIKSLKDNGVDITSDLPDDRVNPF